MAKTLLMQSLPYLIFKIKLCYNKKDEESGRLCKNSLLGMELLNSIVGIVPQTISAEQTKYDL